VSVLERIENGPALFLVVGLESLEQAAVELGAAELGAVESLEQTAVELGAVELGAAGQAAVGLYLDVLV